MVFVWLYLLVNWKMSTVPVVVAPHPIGEEVPNLSPDAAPVTPVASLPPLEFDEVDEPLVIQGEPQNHDMTLDKYSENSVVLRGSDSRHYKSKLREMNGKWNRNLQGGQGWIFSKKREDELSQFLDDVSAGLVNPDDPTQEKTTYKKGPRRINASRVFNDPHVSNQGPVPNIPTISRAPNEVRSGYQQVNWVLFRPEVGMRCTLRLGGKQFVYLVSDIEVHNKIVDVAYITLSGAVSKVVIQNGHWKVWGLADDHHTVYFQ